MRPEPEDGLAAHRRAAEVLAPERLPADLAAALGEVAAWPASRDAHLDFVATVDRPRSLARARRMRRALRSCREADALDLERLGEWQGLAVPARRRGLRQGPARAKGGRERYGFWPGLHAELDARLRQRANDPPLLGAVRAYLDVAFYHPFRDGNARAARLAFEFLARRGGLSFRALGPLFVLPIPAGSESAYLAFLRLALTLARAPESRGHPTRSPPWKRAGPRGPGPFGSAVPTGTPT